MMAKRQHNLGEFGLPVSEAVLNQTANVTNSHPKYEHLRTGTETLGHSARNTALTVSFRSMFIRNLLY